MNLLRLITLLIWATHLFWVVSFVSLAADAPAVELELEPLEFGRASQSVTSQACELGWGFCADLEDSKGERSSTDKARPLKVETPGAVGQQLGIESNLNVSASGRAGARASIVGLGRSAEETDVRTLGISLNPPQGGGFDFSTFPSGFWSDWRISMAQVSATDVRSTGGRMELLPWTAAQVLSEPGESARIRLLESASTLDVFESSVGWAGASRRQAAWVGWSLGEVQGPSASLSWVGRSATWKSDAHLLFSDLLGQSPGSLSFPTPGATQRSRRIVPVLGASRTGTWLGEVSFRAFGDWGLMDYSAPSIAYGSTDHSRRLGLLAKVRSEPWRSEVGFSAEESRLDQEGGSLSPNPEWTLQAWAQRAWGEPEVVRLEPSVSAIWVTGLSSGGGLQAGVVARHSFEEVEGLTTGLNLTSKLRVPSLLNRFYQSPFFMGNPNLEPERVWGARWSLSLGAPGSGRGGSSFWTDLSAFHEYRENVLLTTGVFIPSNSGLAQLSGVEFSVSGEWLPGWLGTDVSVRWTQSEVTSTGEAFPLVPAWSTGGGLHFKRWGHSLSLLGRAVSRFTTGLNGTLPGFAVWSAEWAWLPRGEASGFRPRVALRIDNLADREAAWIPDYPLPGRTFSVALSSELE
jgi:hypothetical protein